MVHVSQEIESLYAGTLPRARWDMPGRFNTQHQVEVQHFEVGADRLLGLDGVAVQPR